MRNAARLSLGELGSRVPLLLLEMVLARILGPALYGVWSIIQTFATYGNFLHLGVASSLARREPGLIQRGAYDEVRANRAAAYGLQFLVVGGVAVLILAMSAMVGGVYDAIGGLSTALAVLLVILVQQITITTQASAINEYKIMEISVSRLVFAFSFLLIGVIVVRFQPPLLWLTLGWVASLVVALLLLNVLTQGILVVPSADPARTAVLLKDGFPIMLQGLLRFGLVSIDKLAVFAVARPEALGYYGMGSLAASVTGLFGTMISRVSLPTLLRLREKDDGIDLLQAEFYRMTALIQVLTYGALFLICSFSPLLVFFFLPAYEPAMRVIGILALAGGFGGLAQAMSDVAMSLGVKAAVLWNTSATLVLQAVLVTLAWNLGAGIEGMAGSVVIAMVLMSARGYWLAMTAVGLQNRAGRRHLGRAAVRAAGVLLACLGGLELQIASVDMMAHAPSAALALNALLLVLSSSVLIVAVKQIRPRREGSKGLGDE